MSDYLTDEEQLARLRALWERWGTPLLVVLALVAAAVVGWRWYQSNLEARIQHVSDLYAEFQQADGEKRNELADWILQEGKGTAYPTFVLLQQAEARVAEDDAAGAEPLLRRAIEAAPGEELADLARLRLARVLFALDRTDEALGVLGQIRGEGYLSLAAELTGDIHLARGDRVLAHQAYTKAMSHVQAGDQRPLLEMKIADTADSSDT